MTKIYVECTHTYDTDLNTGIQRVVRNILHFLPESGRSSDIEIVPVILHHGHLIAVHDIPPSTGETPKSPLIQRAKNYFKNIYRALRTLLCALFPFTKFHYFMFAPRTVFGMNYLIDHTLLIPLKLFRRPKLDKSVPLVEQEDALLLLLDSSWHLPIWGAVDKMRQRGIRVFAVTYDLIPITHPRFCDETLVHLFNEWFTQAMRRVEAYIAISQTVRDDLIDYLDTLPSSADKPDFGYFHLGADLKKSLNAPMTLRPQLSEWLDSASAPYLIVCTIEPRKNHAYLLDVFDRLWEKGLDVRLMIVGRIGWKVDDLIDRIRSHREFGTRLTMWNDLYDAELIHVYAHAKTLLFPSFVEGYGLPIVESLYNALPVLASDIPIHREVGGESIGYFDLNNTDSLVEWIEKIESEGIPEKYIPKEYSPLTWQQSADNLLSEIIRISGKKG